jgi:hypothetical protein
LVPGAAASTAITSGGGTNHGWRGCVARGGQEVRGIWKEEPGMIGSSLVPIVVPIVAFAAMAAWLSMVFWADAHPHWKAHAGAPGPEVTAAEAPPAVAGPGARQGSETAPSIRDKTAA